MTVLHRFRDPDWSVQSPLLQLVFAFHLHVCHDAAAWCRLPDQVLEISGTQHGCTRPGLYPPLVVRAYVFYD